MFPFRRVRTPNTPEAQIRKVRSELQELLDELNADRPDAQLTAEEYWDVVQAVSTLGHILRDYTSEQVMSKARLRVVERTIKRGYYEEAGE